MVRMTSRAEKLENAAVPQRKVQASLTYAIINAYTRTLLTGDKYNSIKPRMLIFGGGGGIVIRYPRSEYLNMHPPTRVLIAWMPVPGSPS